MRNRNFPEYIKAEKESLRNPQNLELRQKAIEEQKKMNSTE